ncbi:MAG TPA: HRDC domain-containing protein [Pyrinomonadaceae bacterium]|jgi:superfamily II DNA helicase RecQ
MKCKTFKIHLAEDARGVEEAKLDKFLESINVRQTFASIVGDEYWSILVFYEEAANARLQIQDDFPVQAAPPVRKSAAKPVEAEKPAPEPLVLTPEQENKFNLLKQWRNERANQDGLPPYMIAQNESLMQIAASDVETIEDFLSIKGFGEKRAQKYGEEILNILDSDTTL